MHHSSGNSVCKALKGRRLIMAEVMMFLMGFTAITTVYEIAKTSKSNQSNKLKRSTDNLKKIK